jgi:hypothetical protein
MVACQWNYRTVSRLLRRGFLIAAISAKAPQPRGSCTKGDVPDHLRWGQLSRRREGRYTYIVSLLFPPSWCREATPLRPGCSAPHPVAVMRAKSEPRCPREEGCHVPTEVRKLLVNALESHGYCVWLCVVGDSVSQLLGGVEEV